MTAQTATVATTSGKSRLTLPGYRTLRCASTTATASWVYFNDNFTRMNLTATRTRTDVLTHERHAGCELATGTYCYRHIQSGGTDLTMNGYLDIDKDKM